MTEDPHWRAVPVASLPYPEDLFRCPWREEFLGLSGGTEDQALLRQAFEEFLATRSDFSDCPSHELDWATAADVACSLVDAGLADDADRRDAALRELGPDEGVYWAVWAFFTDPMWISGERFGNDQHRSCALRSQGAKRCPILP